MHDVCLYVRDIKSGYQQKTMSYVRRHWTDILLHKTHHKVLVVLNYQGLTCEDPLWHHHPFSQRNMATKKVGVGVKQNLIKRWYEIQEGCHKIWGGSEIFILVVGVVVFFWRGSHKNFETVGYQFGWGTFAEGGQYSITCHE